MEKAHCKRHVVCQTDGGDHILSKINQRKLKKLVFITVNAKPGDTVGWDKKMRAPGLLNVASTITSAPMENYSFETVNSFKEKVDAEYLQPKRAELDVIQRR